MWRSFLFWSIQAHIERKIEFFTDAIDEYVFSFPVGGVKNWSNMVSVWCEKWDSLK